MDFKDLTPEQKAKVRACETAEELASLAAAEGIDLSSGGGYLDARYLFVSVLEFAVKLVAPWQPRKIRASGNGF